MQSFIIKDPVLTADELSEINKCLNDKESTDFFQNGGFSFNNRLNYGETRLFRQYERICAGNGLFRVTKDDFDNYSLEGRLKESTKWTPLIVIPLPELRLILSYVYKHAFSESPKQEVTLHFRLSEITRQFSTSFSRKTQKRLSIEEPQLDKLEPFSRTCNISALQKGESSAPISTSFSPEQLDLVCDYIKEHSATKPPSAATRFLAEIPALQKSRAALQKHARKFRITPLNTSANLFSKSAYFFRISKDNESNNYYFHLGVPARGIDSVSVEITPEEIQSILDRSGNTQELVPVEKPTFIKTPYSTRTLSRAESIKMATAFKTDLASGTEEKMDEPLISPTLSVDSSEEKENTSPRVSLSNDSKDRPTDDCLDKNASCTLPNLNPPVNHSPETLLMEEAKKITETEQNSEPPTRKRASAIALSLYPPLSYDRRHHHSAESYLSSLSSSPPEEKTRSQSITNKFFPFWDVFRRARSNSIMGDIKDEIFDKTLNNPAKGP